DRIASFRLSRRNRIEHDRGGIRALARADDVDAGALRPNLQLLDCRRAERIGGADQRRASLALEQIRQLPDRRRLACTVDADDERHLWMLVDGDRPIDSCEHAADLVLDEIAEARAVARS